MSDLQDALTQVKEPHEGQRYPVIAGEPLAVIVKAARKYMEIVDGYANPDYGAMLRLLWMEFYSDMEGNPSDLDEVWEYNREWSEIQMSGLPERLWAAALSVTEAAEAQVGLGGEHMDYGPQSVTEDE